MDIGGQGMLNKDLEASVTGLPSNYDVFIGWNPSSNSDVGWLTLKKGVTRDFKHLQLRDFNLNNLESTSDLFRKVEVVDYIEGYSPVDKNKNFCDPKDSKLTSVLKIDEANALTPVEKVTSKVKSDVDKLKVDFSEKVPLRVEMGKGSPRFACVYCNRNIKDKERHEAKCPSKNAKNTERVKCPICSYRVLRKGLTQHMKIHRHVTRNCSHCGIPVKEEGYNAHLVKCMDRYKRHHEFLCPVCKKSFGSMFSLNKHMQSLHPNVPASLSDPVIKLKNSERADVKLEMIIEKVDETIKNENTISEDVDYGNKENDLSEDNSCGGLSVQDFSVMDTEGEFHPAWDNDEQALCRLKFEMEVDGIVNKKTIKTLMFKSVEKSMRKFTKHVGHNFDDLEFKSNDTVLSGEELAGSIDKGLIKVSLISFDIKEGDPLEVSEDVNPASNLEDLRSDSYEEMRSDTCEEMRSDTYEEMRSDTYEEMRSDTYEVMRSDWFKTPPLFHHSTPAPSDTCSSTQEANEDFPVLDSASVGFSEGATDNEDMDIDGEVVGESEHVVDFSMF